LSVRYSMSPEDISKEAQKLIDFMNWKHRNDKANYEFERFSRRHPNHMVSPMEEATQKAVNDATKDLRCRSKSKPKNKDRFKRDPDGTNPITDTLDV
jgi:hypothetical protein